MQDEKSVKELHCANCGGPVSYDPSTQMTVCSFCGSKFEISDDAEDSEGLYPKGIMPFAVKREDCHKAMLSWLSDGDYTPADILTGSEMQPLKGVYIPMYFFHGTYRGNWAAKVGYYKTKDNGESTEEIDYWDNEDGEIEGAFEILAFGGEKDSISKDAIDFASYFDFDRTENRPFDNQYLLGYEKIGYKYPEDVVWDALGKKQLDEMLKGKVEDSINGDEITNLSCDNIYDAKPAIMCYIPCWILTYRYNDVDYNVFVDGRDVERIDGTKPENVDMKKQLKQKMYKVYISAILSLVFWFLFFDEKHSYSETTQNLMVWIPLLFTLGMYTLARLQRRIILQGSKNKREKTLQNIS